MPSLSLARVARRWSAAVTLSVLAITPGCRQGTDPEPSEALIGTWVLRTANGAPLPFVVSVSQTSFGGTETYTLLADTLVFDAGGEVVRVSTWRHVSEAPVSDTVYTNRYPMQYRRAGDRVELGWFPDCGPLANCAPNDFGRVVGRVLELDAHTALTRPGTPPRFHYEAGTP